MLLGGKDISFPSQQSLTVGNKKPEDKGLRFNEGKTRFDLLEPYAMEQLAKIFTRGAEKYAPNNWLKGLPWMDVVASLKRHLSKFEQGEDFDDESKLLHMAHVAWNALAVVSYYKHRPEYDNRNHSYLRKPRIGVDIDDIINCFVDHWCKYHSCSIPDHWQFDREIGEKIKALDKEFWLSIPCKFEAKDIPFIPACYITARSIDEKWTQEWLDTNNFPHVPLYSVGFGQSKLEVCKKEELDYFIDDNYDTFLELNKNGICTFLMDMPHNQRHNVGYKRVYSLKDFSERFL